MRVLLILTLLFTACGSDEPDNEPYSYGINRLEVLVYPHEGAGEGMVKVVIESANYDKFPAPSGEGIAETRERAMAIALQDMSNKILQGNRP